MYRFVMEPLIELMHHFKAGGKNDLAKEYREYVSMLRHCIEMYQEHCPGSLNAGGVANAALCSEALGDRPLKDEMDKMEAALQVAIELGNIPLDICLLKKTMGRWKGNLHMVSEAAKKYRNMGWIREAERADQLVDSMRSGKVTALDLTKKGKSDLKSKDPDQERLLDIEKQLADARAAANAAEEADDEDAEDEARDRIRKLKKEKKALQKKIASKSSEADDAKVAELRKKIADARQRANDADEAGDEDAEDEARADIRKLKKELKALRGDGGKGKNDPSRVEKKLIDAKKLDEDISGDAYSTERPNAPA